MTKPRVIIENSCYHIFSRGNHKNRVFQKDNDYRFYLKKLKQYKQKFNIRIYSYCLMPNHIHLLAETAYAENLSKFMQCLHRSYTSYFNNTYDKVGHLWQGRFKTKLIQKDQYFQNCISYIEHNPVKDNLVESPQDYVFSSFTERHLPIEKKHCLVDEIVL